MAMQIITESLSTRSIPYVDKTKYRLFCCFRMWGGLTRSKDNPPTENNKDAIDGVQINLWSKDWADGIDMYNMGTDLINTTTITDSRFRTESSQDKYALTEICRP